MQPYELLGRSQHGIVSRRQLVASGVPPGTIDGWAAGERLVAIHPGVYRVAGAPVTAEGELVAAVLASEGLVAASHRSAARLWGLLPDSAAPVPEVTVRYESSPLLRGVIVHRSRDLAPGWVSLRRGVPTVNPLLTMVDLGAVVPRSVVEDCLDRGLTARLFTCAAIEWVYNEVARPGRRGCGVLRRLLDERALGEQPADGLLEPRMARLLRAAALPPAVFQHQIFDDRGRFVARADFAYPQWRVAIEVDGWSSHATARALTRDDERQNDLVLHGWTVLRFTWRMVVQRPRYVAETIAAHIQPFVNV